MEGGKREVTLTTSNPGPRGGLFVDCKVRGTSGRFLIDTGSTDTLISSTIYYQIPREKRPALDAEKVQVRQVDGSPLEVLGTAWVDVQVGRTTHPVKAVRIKMKCQGILGMDFLLPTGGYLDFQTQGWRMNGERIKCTSSTGDPFVGRVVVTKTTVLPSGHDALIPGRIAGREEGLEGPAVVEPPEEGGDLAKRGLVLTWSLTESGNDAVPLRVFNPCKSNIVARTGTTFGRVTAVESEAIQSGVDRTESTV